MTPSWIDALANSKGVALMLSLAFNVILTGALWRVWKSKEALGDRVSSVLADLSRELIHMMQNRVK